MEPLATIHKGHFRPDLLSLRRRMRDLSQSQLADACGITQGTLSKIEQGLREPTEEMLDKMAAALCCAASFFYQAEREYGPPMSAHPMFRKKASVGQKVLDRVIAELNVRIGHLRTFLSAVDFAPELPLPQYDADDFGGDIEVIAEQVRRAWYVPRGPLKSLTEYVERAGCLVIYCDMEAARIDGVSYRIAGLPPVIFLNRNQPADRMRFSLAHELGHLILHAYPTPEMEKQADRFASALLMPAADIGPELNGLTIEKAAYMKPVWRVSMASLIYRATTLNRVDRYKSEYLWRQMATRNFRLREPASLDFPYEVPTVMEALVKNLTDNMGYSEDELAKVLHLYYDEVAQLYGLPKKASQAGLRIVK
jgi:Zn-dependent peptidase ImmA (M78 family)/transcriptional regulator with XRE-family HTH domain